MALHTLKPDGTEGTAIVELIYENGKEIRRHYGCIVKNDANLKSFIKPHIKQSADKTKFKESKYFVCMYDPDFEEERNEATVRVSFHRFSKPSKPKECTLDSLPHNFVKVQGHIFFPCYSQLFNDSNFLEKHSKKILVARGLSEKINGLTYEEENDSPKFIPLKLDHPLSSNVYGIGAEDYEKLEDAGPVLLQNNRTVVGSLIKRGNNEISISIFGNNQEITTASSTDGAPDKRTGQTVATPGDGTGQAAATPGDGTGQPAATPGDGNGQPAATPGDGTGQPAATLGDRTGQQTMFLSDFFEKDAENIRTLSRYLDRRSLVIKNYEDLANSLNAPPLIIAKCKSMEHSPTLDLMQLEEVSTLLVNELVEKLEAISRKNVANKIKDNIAENERECLIVKNALIRYGELFEQVVANTLDTARINNWNTLGLELGIPRDEVKQIGLGCNPTERLLVDYVYPTMEAEELTVARFRDLIKKIEKRSILNLLSESGITEQDDCRSIKDVIPPDSEIMWKLCLELNNEVGGLKNWKHLACSWGIKPEIYSQFKPNQKTSPTEILLKEWLIGERPTFTVNALCRLLGEIKRNDAKEFLEGKLQEYSQVHM